MLPGLAQVGDVYRGRVVELILGAEGELLDQRRAQMAVPGA